MLPCSIYEEYGLFCSSFSSGSFLNNGVGINFKESWNFCLQELWPCNVQRNNVLAILAVCILT